MNRYESIITFARVIGHRMICPPLCTLHSRVGLYDYALLLKRSNNVLEA